MREIDYIWLLENLTLEEADNIFFSREFNELTIEEIIGLSKLHRLMVCMEFGF